MVLVGAMASDLLTVLVPPCLVLWFFWLLLKSRDKLKAPQPPGPRGLPLVGYLPYLGTNLHREFTKLATAYGPIFKLQLGTQPCVVISCPSLVKEVLPSFIKIIWSKILLGDVA